MKYLAPEETKQYLQEVGMAIGEWNQLCDGTGRSHSKLQWINHRAPTQAIEMYNFASHVAGWLPKGEWKIFQIDNSTSFQEDEIFLMERLLEISNSSCSLTNRNTIFFDFKNAKEGDLKTEWLLSSLIFFFLLFQGHGQVVSSNCRNSMHLSIQDGFVYFISGGDSDIVDAKNLISRFEERPRDVPK